MSQRPRPKAALRSHRKNIYCPYYRGCLDYAAKRHWQAWECSRCSHKSEKTKAGGIDVAGTGAEAFEVPGNIVRAISGRTGGLD